MLPPVVDSLMTGVSIRPACADSTSLARVYSLIHRLGDVPRYPRKRTSGLAFGTAALFRQQSFWEAKAIRPPRHPSESRANCSPRAKNSVRVHVKLGSCDREP